MRLNYLFVVLYNTDLQRIIQKNMAMAVFKSLFLCKYKYNNRLWHAGSALSSTNRVVQIKGFHTKNGFKKLDHHYAKYFQLGPKTCKEVKYHACDPLYFSSNEFE